MRRSTWPAAYCIAGSLANGYWLASEARYLRRCATAVAGLRVLLSTAMLRAPRHRELAAEAVEKRAIGGGRCAVFGGQAVEAPVNRLARLA
jgi:hypothetical protein